MILKTLANVGKTTVMNYIPILMECVITYILFVLVKLQYHFSLWGKMWWNCTFMNLGSNLKAYACSIFLGAQTDSVTFHV